MLSLGQLISLTQKDKSSFGTSYRVSSLSITKGNESSHGKFIRVTAVLLGGNEPRVPTIDVYSDSIGADSSVKVLCTCAYFRYKAALYLSSRGATDYSISKKDIPKKLSKDQRQGLCPHLLHLSSVALTHSHADLKRMHKDKVPLPVSAKLKKLT